MKKKILFLLFILLFGISSEVFAVSDDDEKVCDYKFKIDNKEIVVKWNPNYGTEPEYKELNSIMYDKAKSIENCQEKSISPSITFRNSTGNTNNCPNKMKIYLSKTISVTKSLCRYEAYGFLYNNEKEIDTGIIGDTSKYTVYSSSSAQSTSYEELDRKEQEAESNDNYCYYYNEGLAVRVKKNSSRVLVDKVGMKTYSGDREPILNYERSAVYGKIPAYKANSTCPENIILANPTDFWNRGFYVFADNESNSVVYNSVRSYYSPVSSVTYTGLTKEEYNDLLFNNSPLNTDIVVTGDGDEDQCGIFGDKNDAGGIDKDGKERPASLSYMINQALNFMRIVAIILVIALGIVDFAKAVIASKEDEMKKAQTTFMKRLIVCVVIFLIPIFIDIVMQLTDEYLVKYVDNIEIVNCDNK